MKPLFSSLLMGKTLSKRVFLLVLPPILLTLLSIVVLDNGQALFFYFPKKLTNCDIFNGTWTPYEGEAYYTNSTCTQISDRHNCIKFGRPNTEFLKWKWKPNECDLPGFNALQFLELVRGKSMAFLGDSIARNQKESLVCLLSAVSYPEAIINKHTMTNEKFKRWFYADYNFTLAKFWTPFLVKERDAYSQNSLTSLYLDEPDDAWASDVEHFDYLIISAGQWFYRSVMYYENGQVIGCYACNVNNITKIDMYYGYKMAFRTTFKALRSLEKYKGMTILRTFSPAHYENGEWNNGGNCVMTKPFTREEKTIEPWKSQFYLTQTKEFRAAEMEGKNRGIKFSLLDTTPAMLLRPDGHPSKYGHAGDANVTAADCTHWCLPGPIDTWNEFLLQLLKMEGEKPHKFVSRKQQEKN